MTYADNLRAIYALTTPEEYRRGLDWYSYAGSIAASIAAESGLHVQSVAAIIAALSPRNKWQRNILDARAYAMAAKRGEPRPVAATFTKNRHKAWQIANGERWQDHLSGRKVEAFIANITGDLSRGTMDVWAVRAATFGLLDAVKSDRQYRELEDAYREVAQRLGLETAQFQAIIWIVVKRISRTRNISADIEMALTQTTLWED